MDWKIISLVALMKEQFCPVCKKRIGLSKIFLGQFKKDFECDHCHSRLKFSTSRILMLLIIGISIFFPFDFKFRLVFIALMAIFYFPIISIWLGFEESDQKSHKQNK